MPSPDELKLADHHFIGHLSVADEYNVSKFESDILELLDSLFLEHKIVILAGGSGLYIHAVCHGIDDLPDVDSETRKKIKELYLIHGLSFLQEWLQSVDPEYYSQTDKANPNRLMRALEIYLQTGLKYSSLRHNKPKPRNFDVYKIALDRPRNELHEHINQRVDLMIQTGLIEEARQLYPLRYLNALNTVGYKELFDFFESQSDLDTAIEKIKTNSRRYARRQLTWLRKDQEFKFFHPDQIHEMKLAIDNFLKT